MEKGRVNLVVLLMAVFAVSLLAGCATTTARVGEDLSWWGKSGAESAPVKDALPAKIAPVQEAKAIGSWWMPDKAATEAENNAQWGNRGYVYVAETPAAPAPKPVPVAAVAAPKPAEKIVEKKVYVDKIVEKPVEKIVTKTVYVDKPVAGKTVYVNVQDVYFLCDKSTLTPFARGILDLNAEVFKKYPNIKAVLIGYASPEASSAYNLKLSERRAVAVKDYLVKAGVPESVLTVKPMGELEAAKPAWPFARKVHFEVISE